MRNDFNNIDEYINSFSEEIQVLLNQIRETIRQAAPEAVESIGYGMPAFKTNGKPLVYFAAFKNHIGFYATPTGHLEFADELSKYRQGKGSVQFPIDKPMPLDLIARITRFRVTENLSKSKLKPGKKLGL
jgi:uncharacterized protein YdhG (YjbR/CyaY superfamily)